MKLKNVKLEWYALIYDSNKRKVAYINILGNTIKEDIAKKVRKQEIIDLIDLNNYLEKEFRYYYWSRAECELVISGLFEREWENAEKIDIYYQLKPNLNRIAEYINNIMDLKLV